MIGLAAMVYDPLYHAREIPTIKLSSQFLEIIPLALVGYEMIIANSALLISNSRSWNNC